MKNKETLEKALRTTIHHVDDHKVRLMVGAGAGPEHFEHRFHLVRENVAAALKQIEKIRSTAKNRGYQEILDLLDEASVEAGHDR